MVVNSISLVEIVYAAEKTTTPLTGAQRDYVFDVLDRDDSPFLVVARGRLWPAPCLRFPAAFCRTLLTERSPARGSPCDWPSSHRTNGSVGRRNWGT